MGQALNSFDNLLYSAATYGLCERAISDRWTATTAANTTSGYVTGQRCAKTFTVPSLGTGVTGAYCTYCRMVSDSANTLLLVAKEVDLGSLAVSTNTFTSGSSMPTNTIAGSSVQTASVIPVIYISATLTATTPVLTVTYTDQAGNTGQTASLTLPTNAALGSVFLMSPHLASGDSGVRAVTNMSKSAGTVGTIVAKGLLPIWFGCGTTSGLAVGPDPLVGNLPLWPLSASDKIGFFRFGSASAGDLHVFLGLVADY